MFANQQDIEEYILSNVKHASKKVALREALAANMLRNCEPKLAMEHLSKELLDNGLKIQLTTKEQQLVI